MSAQLSLPVPDTQSLAPLVTVVDRLLELEQEVSRLRTQVAIREGALNSASAHFIVFEVLAPGCKVVFANRAFLADYGFEAHEVIDKKFESLGISLWNSDQSEAVLKAIREGRDLRLEAQVVRKNGRSFWAGFYIAPIRDAAGTITHYMATGADITAKLETEKKKRELQNRLYSEMHERERLSTELRLAHKLEAVGRLAAGIAHEINTPIQYVSDSVHFLRDTFHEMQNALTDCSAAVQALPETVRDTAELKNLRVAVAAVDLDTVNSDGGKAFERTLEGIERVTGIVKGMREFAHPNAVEQAPADLNHAIETTLAVARSEYKHIAAIDLKLGELPSVVCNVGELNQVFLNLIVNAAQAVQDAGKDVASGRITLSTAVTGSRAEITIADNGCGISDETLDRIFDPFFTTKDVGRGTGQGLAISRSIVVDRHGGNIQVRSVVGLGTQFTIRLPLGGRGN